MTRASDLARLLGAGATINDGTTITTADNNPQLTLISTDADENVGPEVDLYRNSASPADGDIVGRLVFNGENDADEKIDYANIQFRIADASDGTEDAKLLVVKKTAGADVSVMASDATETVFNDSSIDLDFRVESNGNTHAIFVDGGNDVVGIGTSSPSSFNGGANNLVVGTGSGSEGITIFAANDSNSAIFFADGDSTTTGQLNYQHASNVMTFHTNGGTERARITSNGLHVNSTRDIARICVDSNIASYAILSLKNDTNNTGSFFVSLLNHSGSGIGGISQASETTVAFNTSSDYRLKENVEYDWDATTRLKQLKPARFNWISDDTNTAQDGFLAHEVSNVVPLAINGVKDGTRDIGTIKDEDGNILHEDAPEIRKEDGQTWTKTGTEVIYQSIDHSKLVPLLVKTIQELEARISSQETNINDLQKRVTALEGS